MMPLVATRLVQYNKLSELIHPRCQPRAGGCVPCGSRRPNPAKPLILLTFPGSVPKVSETTGNAENAKPTLGSAYLAFLVVPEGNKKCRGEPRHFACCQALVTRACASAPNPQRPARATARSSAPAPAWEKRRSAGSRSQTHLPEW